MAVKQRTYSSYRHVRLRWQDSYEEMGWGSGWIWEWKYISITDNGRELKHRKRDRHAHNRDHNELFNHHEVSFQIRSDSHGLLLSPWTRASRMPLPTGVCFYAKDVGSERMSPPLPAA
jgi:hypothetical protein